MQQVQAQSVAPAHGGPDQADLEDKSRPNQEGAGPPGPRPNQAPQAHTTPHALAPSQPVQAQSVAPAHGGPDQAGMGSRPDWAGTWPSEAGRGPRPNKASRGQIPEMEQPAGGRVTA